MITFSALLAESQPNTSTRTRLWPRNYGGWMIYDRGSQYHPATGRFSAVKNGVSMSHSQLEGLLRMIDTRLKDNRSRGWNAD